MSIHERVQKLAQPTQSFVSRPHGHWINGREVPSASGETFQTYDPYTDEPICRVALGGPEDARRAVAAARSAFDDGRWSAIDPRARATILLRIAERIERDLDPLAQLITLDNGKPLRFSRGELVHCVDVLRYYAGLADKVFGETHATAANQFIYTLREPVGVCAQIIPWNFPAAMTVWKVAPALALGNTSVLKPAEETPLFSLWLAQTATEVGLPDGVFNVLCGDGPGTGAALLDTDGIDKIAFTGSTEVGKLVLSAAARRITNVTLELGGKSPNIVFGDADVSQAVPQALFGIFFNSGQVCSAGSRLLVEDRLHDEFMSRLVEQARSWRVGDGLEEGVTVGPLVSRSQYEKVTGYIDKGHREGARCVTGGKRLTDARGYLVEPTIFDDVRPDMAIARDEIFGPVLSVMRFRDLEEAIRIANDTMYGLASAVWTRNLDTAIKMARGIRAGTVWINTYGRIDPAVPFGGYKQSGIGREMGIHSVEAYTQVKSVWIAV